MTLQKIALSVVATVAALALTPALRADTHIAVSGFGGTIVTPNAGIGVWIGQSAPERHYYPGPVYRGYGPPWRHRVVRMGPPVVVVRPPVVVQPAPPVVMEPAPPVIQDSTVTVWITNSNGSQTTVQLTRRNGWYVGPRGEYYDQMPTNEQLRLAYGF
jgi:hypothetical protein